MARISATLLHNRAKEACKACGLDWGKPFEVVPAPERNDGLNVKCRAIIGRVTLANVPVYGGWDLEQVVNEGGATRALNGHGNRMKAAEMLAFLDGMILAAHKIKAVQS